MLGWFKPARAFASRSKRSFTSGVTAHSGEHLDRDDALESRVARFVDVTQAACAEGGLDFVGTKLRAWTERYGAGSLGHRPRLYALFVFGID